MAEDKSKFLKECIVDATFHLMKKKSITKITVDDIIKRAGVGRMTYFRNFTNKMEIIFYKLNSLHDTYFNGLPKLPKTEEEKTLELLKFIYSIKDTYTIIYKQSPLFILIYFHTKATPDEGNAVDDIYRTAFYINGFVGIVGKWCDREFAEPPEEIFKYIKEWQVLNNTIKI